MVQNKRSLVFLILFNAVVFILTYINLTANYIIIKTYQAKLSGL